jgi:hypothetical protein
MAIGCKRSNDPTPQKNYNVSPKISTLLKLSSPLEQKLAYLTLDTNEKAAIWKEHLSEIIKSGIFNAQKNKLLTEIAATIKPAMFQQPKQFSEMSDYERDWLERANKVFSKNELKIAVSSLSIPSTLAVNPNVVQQPSSCGCSQSSDWCGSNFYCDSANCTKASSGCGTFFQYSCNGNCTPIRSY